MDLILIISLVIFIFVSVVLIVSIIKYLIIHYTYSNINSVTNFRVSKPILNYIKRALSTENKAYHDQISRCNNTKIIRLLHGVMGLADETGELQKCVKNHIFYGKSLDTINIVEEMGDILWFLALIMGELNVDFESVMQTNILKLTERYKGKGFDKYNCLNRDINEENKIVVDYFNDKKTKV